MSTEPPPEPSPGRSTEPSPGPQRSRRRTIAAVVVSLAALIAVFWWWWPSLTPGSSGEADVVVVGDSFLRSTEPELSNRLHEDGFTVADPVTIADWCDAPDAIRAAVDEASPSRVVVSAAGDGSCGSSAEELRDEVVDAAGDATAVVVVPPGSASATAAALSAGGAVVVDPTRLLGAPDSRAQPCQWWDQCQPDGTVVVRDDDGVLSPAGATRVARMTVGALR